MIRLKTEQNIIKKPLLNFYEDNNFVLSWILYHERSNKSQESTDVREKGNDFAKYFNDFFLQFIEILSSYNSFDMSI